MHHFHISGKNRTPQHYKPNRMSLTPTNYTLIPIILHAKASVMPPNTLPPSQDLTAEEEAQGSAVGYSVGSVDSGLQLFRDGTYPALRCSLIQAISFPLGTSRRTAQVPASPSATGVFLRSATLQRAGPHCLLWLMPWVCMPERHSPPTFLISYLPQSSIRFSLSIECQPTFLQLWPQTAG